MAYYIDNHYFKEHSIYYRGDWVLYGGGYISIKKEYAERAKIKVSKIPTKYCGKLSADDGKIKSNCEKYKLFL